MTSAVMGSWKRVDESKAHGMIVSGEREGRNYVLKLQPQKTELKAQSKTQARRKCMPIYRYDERK